MARFLAWLSLVAYAAATMHNGGGGGESIPFDLSSLGSLIQGKQGGGGGGGQGKSMNKEMENQAGGGGGGGAVTLVVLWTNQGGGAQNEVQNEPMMEEGTEHQVTVGGDAGLVYTPDSVTAAAGDMIRFDFLAMNHTVTQSTFADPCTKMTDGVDSGFVPNPNNTEPAPSMMFQVMDTNPVWMYCAQGPHCQNGMVFSVNPTEEKSQAAFKEKAMGGGNQTGGNAASSSAAPPPAQPTVVAGQGNQGDGGECSCSCLCGMSAFSSGSGGWGGMPGSMPMPARRKRATYF